MRNAEVRIPPPQPGSPLLLIPYIRSMTTTSTWFVFALIISAIMAYAGVLIFGVPAYFFSAHVVGRRGSPHSCATF
jgi:hypothetical protein